MRNRIVILLLVMISLWLLTCEKEGPESRPYPQAKTLGVNAITSEGACFNGEIMNPAGYEITDHGFVFSTSSDPTYDYSTRIALGATSAEGSFSAVISSNLRTNVEYYVKAWVKTTDKVMLGLPVKFVSLGSKAPVVNGFFPKSGTWGDTIAIAGKNFGNNSSDCISYFGTVISRVFAINDTLIKTIVPESMSEDSCLIAVEIIGNRSTGKDYFFMDMPVQLFDFNPKEAQWLDTIVINGVFPNDISIDVYIENTLASITERSDDVIKAIIPSDVMIYDGAIIRISFNNHMVLSNEKLFLTKPYIISLPGMKGKPGEIIRVQGLFNPNTDNTGVIMDGQTVSLLQCTKTELKFAVPEPNQSLSPKISIQSGGLILVNDSKFEYDKPLFDSVSASIINAHSTIKLYGSGFISNNTQVLFDNTEQDVSSVSDSVITFKPSWNIQPNIYSLRIKVLDYLFNPGIRMDLGEPKITGIDPLDVTFLDTITIQYQYIDQKISYIEFNGYGNCLPIQQGNNSVTVALPEYIGQSENRVYLAVGSIGVITPYGFPYRLKKPFINSFNPASGKYSETFTITGDYFSPDLRGNQVYFGKFPANVLLADSKSLSGQIPHLSGNSYTVKLKVSNYSIIAMDSYQHISPMTFMIQFTKGLIGLANYMSFVQDNKIYIVFGELDDVWFSRGGICFDVLTKEFHNIPEYPGEGRAAGVSFIYGQKVYMGLGSDRLFAPFTDFYIFDTQTETWSAGPVFPGSGRFNALSFSIGNKAYVGGGTDYDGPMADFWEFDLENNTWKEMANLPIRGNTKCHTVLNDKAYVFYENEFLIFNSVNQKFSRHGYISYTDPSCCFVINQDIFLCMGSPYKIIKYNTELNTWERLSDSFSPEIGLFKPSGFSYLNKGYIYNGGDPYNPDTREGSFYEFDPSKIP